MGYEFKRPDPAAMERTLERCGHSPEGVILRLAWQAGLSREEIAGLQWPQVNFEENTLTLNDRTVPLEEAAAVCLRKRWQLYHTKSDHVVISDRYKKPMPPESVSRLARGALDTEGISVSLKDLRQDFVIRALETHGWPYAARVSGMAVSTLRGAFSQYFRPRDEMETPPTEDAQESEYLLWRILQQEGSSLVGLALWMSWKLRMRPGEIVALTWDQVDLEADVLRLPDRTLPMGSRLGRMLRDVWARQKDLGQERVLLAPGTGRPIDLARLSTVTRTALIRGGLENVSLGDLCRVSRREGWRQSLLTALAERGSLSREEVTELLGVSKNIALGLLDDLRAENAVTRVGRRYYPAGSVTAPVDQAAAVEDYLRQYGTALRKDLSELLGISPAQTTALLRRMAAAGRVVLTGKKYALPPSAQAGAAE